MPRKAIEMIGKKYGCLYVMFECSFSVTKTKAFRVKCDLCGTERNMLGSNIRRHHKTSPKGCFSCWKPTKTYGMSSHELYGTWESMLSRCYNKKHFAHHRYGGRGIMVCEDWKNDPGKFIKWLLINGKEKGLQIDRIDNNKGYCPENCRVVKPVVNANNRNNNRRLIVFGESLTVSQAARKYKIFKTTIKERLNRGWTGDKVVGAVK